MRYRPYKIEDFVLDESFRNWVLGRDQGDVAFWEEWIKAHPDMKPLVDEAGYIIVELEGEEIQVSREEIDRQYEEIAAYFDRALEKKQKVKRFHTGFIAKIAATVLIILSAGAATFYFTHQQSPVGPAGQEQTTPSFSSNQVSAADSSAEEKTATLEPTDKGGSKTNRMAGTQKPASQAQKSPATPTPDKEPNKNQKTGHPLTTHTTHDGEKQKIILPDGSRVFLNSNSTLAYNHDWKDSEKRKVRLSGEAFFQVREKAHQGRKVKFAVMTKNIEVEVVGTEFDVNTRNEQTQVFLNSGRVNLKIPEKQQTVPMRPGEIMEYDPATGRLISRKSGQSSLISWLQSFGSPLQDKGIPENMTIKGEVDRKADQNEGVIWQSGEENEAYIEQIGEGLSSGQIQQGRSNMAEARLSGKGKEDGGWSTWQIQQGENNVSIFRLVQSYNSNLYSVQKGRKNLIRGRSEGTDNTGAILQSGLQNKAWLHQKGQGNRAIILQQGSSGPLNEGWNQDLLKGRYNKVNIIQKGLNNRVKTLQQGDKNRVNIEQNGK
jgi:hypothetical protein